VGVGLHLLSWLRRDGRTLQSSSQDGAFGHRIGLTAPHRRASRACSGLKEYPLAVTVIASRSKSASRLRWVPPAAGGTVGVIATLSLIASVSPAVRWLIKVPREFINDYLFNFPDTSFAW
jgi:hypothetical protein